jgi:hypothetical protein
MRAAACAGSLYFALGALRATTLVPLLGEPGAAAQIAALRTPPGVIGLVGQIGFGLVPFIQLQWVLRR